VSFGRCFVQETHFVREGVGVFRRHNDP
jgi:hypothetical protein